MTTANFRQSELAALYNADRVFVFAFRSVLQIRYSENAGFYLQKLPHKRDFNFTKRGRFHAVSAESANRILA